MVRKSFAVESEAARFMRVASARPLNTCAIAAQYLPEVDHGEAVSGADRPRTAPISMRKKVEFHAQNSLLVGLLISEQLA